MQIIGLCGRSGSGKSTVVQISKMVFPNIFTISTGDAIRRVLRDRGLPQTPESMQTVNMEIVKERGDAYISFVFESLPVSLDIVFVDSLRRWVDYEWISKNYSPPILLCVSAPPEMRYIRMQARNRSTDPLTEESFRVLNRLEDDWGVDTLCAHSYYKIYNDKPLDEARSQIESILRHIYNRFL